VQWTPKRALTIEAAGDQIAISALGRCWKFRREARPLLEVLISGGEYSGIELESIEGEMLNPVVIRSFLRELAVQGLVAIR
jgi:hypothetical protein